MDKVCQSLTKSADSTLLSSATLEIGVGGCGWVPIPGWVGGPWVPIPGWVDPNPRVGGGSVGGPWVTVPGCVGGVGGSQSWGGWGVRGSQSYSGWVGGPWGLSVRHRALRPADHREVYRLHRLVSWSEKRPALRAVSKFKLQTRGTL